MTPDPIEVGHILDDDTYVRYVATEAICRKILAAQRNGSLGLIRERERLISGQLAQIIETEQT